MSFQSECVPGRTELVTRGGTGRRCSTRNLCQERSVSELRSEDSATWGVARGTRGWSREEQGCSGAGSRRTCGFRRGEMPSRGNGTNGTEHGKVHDTVPTASRTRGETAPQTQRVTLLSLPCTCTRSAWTAGLVPGRRPLPEDRTDRGNQRIQASPLQHKLSASHYEDRW